MRRPRAASREVRVQPRTESRQRVGLNRTIGCAVAVSYTTMVSSVTGVPKAPHVDGERGPQVVAR